MDKPIQPSVTPAPLPKTAPPKAIAPGRDYLQSRLLVASVVPLLCTLGAILLVNEFVLSSALALHLEFYALAISIIFSLLAWTLKAATPAAAACGGIICFLLCNSSAVSPPSLLRSGLPPLVLLFVLTFLATGYRRSTKEAHGLAEARTGRRASQVVANLGIAALLALGWHLAAIAALAEATADTLSSEIGQALGGPAFLITTLRRVPPGTDGAISLTGTLAGLVGATAVVLAALPHPFWSSAPLVFAAATAGLLFDSILGATLERRGYLGNDLVNFISTLFAAAIALALIHALP